MSDQSSSPFLIEAAWEACNQVGGIYTVIRTKVPATISKWGNRYCLLGPYFYNQAASEFEEIESWPEDDHVGQTVARLREQGLSVHYGYWLVTGKPKIVLFDIQSAMHRLGDIKYFLWENHHIQTTDGDSLIDQVLAFGYMIQCFAIEMQQHVIGQYPLLYHFHEWMAGTAIPEMRRQQLDARIVFTTHATLLGRYLAMNDPNFYDHLPFLDWKKEAAYFNVEAQVDFERAAAHGSHVFTTVSDVTAQECIHLLGRQPDEVLPNGINIERFTAMHEFQNMHQEYKTEIHEFVMGHFFPSYTFDLDNTLYFFTSGRYEFRNKGFDVTLEALAKLNWMMRLNNIKTNVVMFFITKRPYQNIIPEVLQSRAVMEEVRTTLNAIQKQIDERLFYKVAGSNDHKLPQLNDLVDDYWNLRLRRTLQSWRAGQQLPIVVTHNLHDDGEDEILQTIRQNHLVNNEYDKVKIVYHPEFISPVSPLFGMEYGQFVRGCHLGIFPSYYEPWGYTPLECIASGVPTVTSDLSGFGDYVLKNMSYPEEKGIYVVNRQDKSFQEAANQLAEFLFSFVQLNRRDRITQRNRVESSSERFDWHHLTSHYDTAYERALS